MRHFLVIIMLLVTGVCQSQNLEPDFDKSLDTASLELNKAGDALLEYRHNRNIAQGMFLTSAFSGFAVGFMEPGAVRIGTGVLGSVLAVSGIVITISNDKHLKDAAIQLKSAGSRIGVNVNF